MGVVSFKILLWLFIWIDCIDLEAQWKVKTQIPKWLIDYLRQVDFLTLFKCIESCISLLYVLGSNGTWWWVYLFILNYPNEGKGLIKDNLIIYCCVICSERMERCIDSLLMLYHDSVVVNCALICKWSSPY